MNTWIVIANRTEAKIFEYDRRKKSDVKFVTKLENPRGRLRSIEINADRPGVFANLMRQGARLVKAQSPTERVAQEFAKSVTVFLEAQSRKKIFEDLILISDPHFMGRLRALFGKDLKRKISREILKDLGPVTADEIKSRIFSEQKVQTI